MMRLGDYDVTRLLGEGGMGKVYEAEERLSKRRVALKVLRPELAKTEEGRRLFLNEMRILAHLEHPSIVRSLASLEVDGQLVMVLEFLDGKTLRDTMTSRGQLPWPQAVAIAHRIAQALSAAHSQAPPIVHRDLKPENVMVLGDDGALKVMDFGIAKVLEAARGSTTQSIGTLQYMSPEQIDAREVDARSDLYSLGLVLYEMLAGRAPFSSASPRELLNLQCTQPPPPLPDEVLVSLPQGVVDVLVALLAKEPAGRPASAAEVVQTLRPFCPAERAVRPPGSLSAGPAMASTAPDAARATPLVGASTGPRTTTGAAQGDHASPRGGAAHTPQSHLAAIAQAGPHRADTVALLERGKAPRQVSPTVALVVIAAASLCAFGLTYALRVAAQGGGPVPEASASAVEPGVER